MPERIFYEYERNQIKSKLSPEALAYVEALETATNAAWELHKTIGLPYETQKQPANAVYDALKRVDFLLELADLVSEEDLADLRSDLRSKEKE